MIEKACLMAGFFSVKRRIYWQNRQKGAEKFVNIAPEQSDGFSCRKGINGI